MTQSVYLVMMAHEGEEMGPIQQKFFSEVSAADMVNGIVRALAIIKFKGLVRFEILKDNIAVMSSLVTFTNDMPNGNWSTVHV
jgi:hypothetical protein